MVEEKKAEKREDDLRFKYIGFDVYSSKAKKFWRNPEEEKRYSFTRHQKINIFNLGRMCTSNGRLIIIV